MANHGTKRENIVGCNFCESSHGVVCMYRKTSFCNQNNYVVFKHNILLQCRRGSNVSLTLDMSSLGNIEPFVAIPTPREKVAMEYLQSASRILTRSQLRDVVASSHLLQSEFMVSLLFVIRSSVGILKHRALETYGNDTVLYLSSLQ